MPDESDSNAASDKVEDAAKALLGGQMAASMPAVDLQTVSSHSQGPESLKTAEKQQEPPRAEPARQPAPASQPALVDAQGRTFDPLLHETDSNGQPVLRKGTNILKCRRVPLKAWKEESRIELPPEGAQQPQDQPETKPEPQVDPAKRAALQLAGATTIAGLQIQLMRTALGEHTASAEEERQMLVEQWQAVFQHYDVGAVHPLVGLAVVSGAIGVKAISHPEGNSRWQRWKQWARLQIGWLLHKMTGRRPVEPQEG